MADRKRKARDYLDTLTAVSNPLRFFALSLLMVESLIAVLSAMKATELLILSVLATIMFLSVVFAVTWLVWKAPEGLLARTPADLLKSGEAAKQKLEILMAGNEAIHRVKEIPVARDGVPVARRGPPPVKG